MGKKIRVGLVYGGRSGEHEVSLQTALAVSKAFDYDKYELVPFYITSKGQWRTGETLLAPPQTVAALKFTPDSLKEAGGALLPVLQGIEERAVDLAGTAEDTGTIDVMFPLLHGTFGEDGTIQGLFEMAGLPYVGAGVLASAAGMDKVTMKKLFAEAGLQQVDYRYFIRKEWSKQQEQCLAQVEELGYPLFVKPANLGSSVGISKARNREELIAAIELALRYDRKVIIEAFIDAREIEVSVLGNDEPQASVPGEIRSSHEFYDYKAKYTDGKSDLIIPADIPPETADQVRALALRAFKAIDGSGLCRADFFLRRSDGELYINEVNTMPGFTPYSMYPLMWRESGVPYRELLDRLIQLAIERFEERQSLEYGNE